MKIDGVDYNEQGLYLSLNQDKDYLRERELLQYSPRRKSNRGAPPKITASGISVQKDNRFKPWNKPSMEPDESV